MPKNQKIKNRKSYGIWAWVGAIYGPIIFWVLFVNLPKIEWKYVFESNKTRVARHHQKASEKATPNLQVWVFLYGQFPHWWPKVTSSAV